VRRSLATAIAVAVCGCAPWLGFGQANAAAITVSVAGRSASPPLANNYLGLALTYQGVTRWSGPASRPADPVLVQLIRNLTPHGHPVLRIGGVSADRSWWPIKGYRKPIGIWYDLTPKWAASLRGLARAAQARLILGVNLEADRPTLVRVESHQLVRRIGRRYIDSLQIGNEPNLYRTVPWYALLKGRPVPQYLNTGTPVYSRPPSWGPAAYAAEIARLLPTLPRLPISGPDASGPDNGASSWIGAFARFLHPPGRAVTVTAHAYAAVKCVRNPASPAFPSIPHMLALAASRDQLNGLEGDIALARGHGDGFRVDEMGTVSCSGLRGVSNSMASALWVLDALFSMDRAGVSGVNLHAVNGINALFVPRYAHGRWRATVEPWYYGALMFAQAAPAGARLLPVSNATHADTRVWATLGRDRAVRVLVINDSIGSATAVRVRNPSGYGRQPATIERLRAPGGADATRGVTLGGRSFGRTETGLLHAPNTQRVRRRGGAYAVTLPPASAALLTLTKGPG
jgi:Glycosyl hydrolase family 79 C-terminal beta domain